VLLIFFVQIVAAEDICQIVPDTNYCVIDGAISYSYNGIPFESTIIPNGPPIYLLVTSPGQTVSMPMNGAITSQIHFMEHMGYGYDAPTGYIPGRIIIEYIDGTTDYVDLVVGVNTDELNYDRPEHAGLLKHAPLTPAYSYLTTYESSSTYPGHFFYTSIATAPKPINRIILQDSGGYGIWLAIDAITLEGLVTPLNANLEIYPADDPTPTTYKPAGKTIPMVGGLIKFDARTSTGDIVKYRWDFGEKGRNMVETSVPTIEHIYREEKTYTVKLEVVDSNGNTAQTTKDFTIPKLQPGDIIFCNTYGYGHLIPGFYTHTGIYIGNGKIVESVAAAGHGLPADGVGISDIMDWSYGTETAVAVYRPMISDKYIKKAVNEAKGFVRQRPYITYDYAFVQKSQQPDSFYCSELVWAAYSLGSGGQGHWALGGLTWIDSYGEINLGYIPSPLGVTPSDIAADPRLQYVAGHWEDEPGSPN
jgi:uncharacterized protein YycO